MSDEIRSVLASMFVASISLARDLLSGIVTAVRTISGASSIGDWGGHYRRCNLTTHEPEESV